MNNHSAIGWTDDTNTHILWAPYMYLSTLNTAYTLRGDFASLLVSTYIHTYEGCLGGSTRGPF